MNKLKDIRTEIARIINDSSLLITAYRYGKDNFTDDKLPAVTVMTGSGTFESGAADCSVGVHLEIKAKGKDSEIEDILDDFAQQIFELLPIGHTLGNLVEYIKPESFEAHVIDPDGSIGTKGLNFNVKYEV